MMLPKIINASDKNIDSKSKQQPQIHNWNDGMNNPHPKYQVVSNLHVGDSGEEIQWHHTWMLHTFYEPP